MQLNTTAQQLATEISSKANTIIFFLVTTFLFMVLTGTVDAASTNANTIFDNLYTETDETLKPLMAVLVGIAGAGGVLFAILKGAWLMAGMGIAVAAMVYAAGFVSDAAGFGALI